MEITTPPTAAAATTIHSSVSKTHKWRRPPPLHFLPPFSTSSSSSPVLLSRISFPNSLTTTRSLPHDSTSTATKEVAPMDHSLAVKKRAADMASELKGTSIFLVGMKSSMKISLGKLLADALRYYYFDSDSLVEEAVGGESAAKSFREKDEKGFRETETEVLKQLSSMGRLVVCAGDGAVQSSTNLALLRHGLSLWIDVPLDIVARGIVEEQSKFSASEVASEYYPEEVLTQLIATYEEMRGGYAIADATISVQRIATKLGYDELDSVTTEDMTLEVLKEIEKLMRVKKMMEEAARPF